MTPKPTYRVGPKMIDALAYVSQYPGIVQQQAAKAIGPNNSHAFGCRILHRCYDHGLIRRRYVTGLRGHRLELTPYGRLVLEADEVTRDDIRALFAEAAQAGDLEQVALCRKALNGEVDGRNWQRCAQVIAEHRIAQGA